MALSLLVADAVGLALSVIRGPQWGVYRDGQPIIQPATGFTSQVDAVLAPIQILASVLGEPNIVPVTASIIEFDFRQDWAIANYPVEGGEYESYDKVTRPYDVRLRIACSGDASKRQAFISSMMTMSQSTNTYDIVTPEAIFTNCNVNHLSWPRRADRGVSMIVAEVTFQKVREAGESTFVQTSDPTNQATQALGNVQGSTSGTVTVRSLTGGIR